MCCEIFFFRKDNLKSKKYAEIWIPQKRDCMQYMIRNLPRRIIA
jgi:hypothetical protein